VLRIVRAGLQPAYGLHVRARSGGRTIRVRGHAHRGGDRLSAAAHPGVRFEILGPLVVRVGERALHPGSSARCALLGLLLLADGRALPADRLLRAVWGDERPDSGRAAVHVAVSRLRGWLELHVGDVAALEHDPGGYRLRVPAGSVDTARFRVLVAESRQAGSPEERLQRLQDALALWRGPVAGESAAPLTGDVLVRQLERLRVDTACDLAAAAVAGRRPELALACLEATADAHPLDERTQAVLAIVLAACGRQAEVLGVVERARARLADELGLDPGPHLQEAHLRILRQQVGRAGPAPAAPVRRSPTSPAAWPTCERPGTARPRLRPSTASARSTRPSGATTRRSTATGRAWPSAASSATTSRRPRPTGASAPPWRRSTGRRPRGRTGPRRWRSSSASTPRGRRPAAPARHRIAAAAVSSPRRSPGGEARAAPAPGSRPGVAGRPRR
jgi:DNA-binding SARP family transcriptional activator